MDKAVEILNNLHQYEQYSMVIDVRPKPYVRMTTKSKFVRKDAQKYLQYKSEFQTLVEGQVKFYLEKGQAFGIVNIAYVKGKRVGDNDNYLKSTKDALNKIAWYDDKYSVIDLAIRKEVESEQEERTEVIIFKL